MAAPTSVTNMTGFLNIDLGLSFLKASNTAWVMMVRSKRECFLAAINKIPLTEY
jgi:hypothetical protein